MSYGTCQLPLRVCVFSWLPWPARPLLVSLTSSLCCSESEDSSEPLDEIPNAKVPSLLRLCALPGGLGLSFGFPVRLATEIDFVRRG